MTPSERVRLYSRLPATPDADWWAAQVTATAGRRVLYLGCGAGRLAAALVDVAQRLVAVDDDAEMLASFRRRLAGSVHEVEAVELLHADAAALDLAESFDVVLLPTGLLNDLADPARRRRTLRRAAEHCAEGGRVIVEVLNPYWLAAIDAPAVGTIPARDGGAPVEMSIEPVDFDVWEQRLRARLTYRFADGERLHDDLDAVALYPGELTRIMARCDLEITQRWGADPGVDPVDRSTPSWHLLCRPRP